jgi:hypothetical protein
VMVSARPQRSWQFSRSSWQLVGRAWAAGHAPRSVQSNDASVRPCCQSAKAPDRGASA